MCSRHKSRRSGFSLIELMVVIVIIGILAGTVTVGVRSYLIRSKQNVAKMEISKIAQAIESFYLEHDRYPSNEEGIEALTKVSEKFPEPLLDRLPNDPWGNPYEYLETNSSPGYQIISYGADGREGGEGADKDIDSLELDER